MDKTRIALWTLSAVLVALYAVDLARHGAAAAWHLVFLIALGGWKFSGFQFGVNLEAQTRIGTRDYLTRFRGMTETQADAAIANGRRLGTSVVLAVLIVIIGCYALGSAESGIDPRPLFEAFIVACAAVGALLLGIMVFGVVHALRHLRG